MPDPMNIALLSGQSAHLKTIPDLLARSGFRCNVFVSPRALIQGVSQAAYDMLLIHDELPDTSAVDVIRTVRCARSRDLPIMMLGDGSNEEALVEALDAGADDYLCGPLSARVLIARIGALRRRATGDRQRQGLVVRAGPYQLNSVGRFALLHGERITLTPKEFDLAMLLFSNAGRVLANRRIEQAIWHHELPPLSRALAGLMSRLRKTLRLSLETGISITVVYAHGYRLDIHDDDPMHQPNPLAGKPFALAHP
ncbi:response regulator transcription factor [Cupriavidus sp. WKF15]|uniref:response regulator transcription factor n=1 Tax=Cupriavidus sp. WKF15 TaxID=3032282 RepID=UPI0023E21091|nr:response regulator transcription factor [Cupriavidus sp. WKF15]WER48292.1 response regulator transcription factor [Cupriavidus sp. WKF15]